MHHLDAGRGLCNGGSDTSQNSRNGNSVGSQGSPAAPQVNLLINRYAEP